MGVGTLPSVPNRRVRHFIEPNVGQGLEQSHSNGSFPLPRHGDWIIDASPHATF